jgi:hypothetical protein
MARVRTVREHQNLYGDKPGKEVGDEYELPDNLAESLTAAGLVEPVGEEPEAPTTKAKPAKARKA